jgi:hypothetical protein
MSFGYFYGVRQSVSGNDFNDRNAPWNQQEPVYETCPYCGGDGGVYYNEEGDKMCAMDYERLSDEDKSLWELDKCEHCDGIGTIMTEPWDIDSDDYD